MLSWLCALCEGSNVQYLSGFVGICLIQYFYRSHADTALTVLLRLLGWKVIFTNTVCRLLKVVDVIKMAVTVSCDSVYAFSCICAADTEYFNLDW